MKGFIFFGLIAGPFYLPQNTGQDSLRTKEIASITFLKRLPVIKEIINVEKDLGSKNIGQDLPILLKNQMSVISLDIRILKRNNRFVVHIDNSEFIITNSYYHWVF